jgi:hypothetical protein
LSFLFFFILSFSSIFPSTLSFSFFSLRHFSFTPHIHSITDHLSNSSASAPQRFGVLNMTTVLGPWIMCHPDVSGDMEQFLLQFVTTEF